MSIYDIEVTAIDGQRHLMATYRDKTLLIVNVASRCVYTTQYEGLEALHREFKDRGFAVLGFPCNQFMYQEPLGASGIQQFCTTNAITFPMFAKVKVNGWSTHPLFAYLKRQRRGWLGTGMIKWNFTKFLVDAAGHVVARYAPNVPPAHLRGAIGQLIAN